MFFKPAPLSEAKPGNSFALTSFRRKPSLASTNVLGDTTATHERMDEKKEIERRLVRKLDLCMLPVLVLMCMFSAVDKGAIGIAKLSGLLPAINLTQTQFNTGLAVFHLGSLALQLPSNLLMCSPNIRPSLYLSACCALWSTVTACHALITDYSSFLLVRIFLGVTEAPFFVGALHLMSCWYTRRELAKRTSVLVGMLVLVLTFVYPTSAGVMGGLDDRNGWEGWRWLFFVFGLAGLGAAVLGVVLLPDYPGGKRRFWLSEEEMVVARRRIEEDRVDEKEVEKHKLWIGLKDACLDGRTWIFVLMMMSRKSLEGLYYYIPSIIKSFHLFPHSSMEPNTLVLFLASPPALLAAVLALLLGYTSDRFSERTFHIAVPLFFALVGIIMSAATTDSIARYISIYLYVAGHVAGTAMNWSWVPNSIQETPEKKACAIAIVNLLGGLGAIWGPFFFQKEDAPEYKLAFGLISGFVVLDITCCFSMRWVLKRQNERLKRQDTGQSDLRLYVL